MKKLLSLLLIVLLLTASLQMASADVEGDIVKFYGTMCELTTAKAWGEDQFNRTYFSAAVFMDVMHAINDENEFRLFGEACINAIENDQAGFAYNEATDTLKAIFCGPEVTLIVSYHLATNILQYEFLGGYMTLERIQMIVESDGFSYYHLSSSLLNGCVGVLNEMFPTGSAASAIAENTSAPSDSPAAKEDAPVSSAGTTAAEGVSVTVTSDYLSLRNANGSTIKTIAKGASFVITGYDASVGMFTAVHEGTTGYAKGTGLNISKNELLNHFQ